MKVYKLLLKEIKKENEWDYTPKDAVKTGKVAFDFRGKIEDEEVEFKKGDEVGYQYGNPANIDGEEYILVSLTSIIWQK